MLFGHHNNDVTQPPMPDATPPVQIEPTLNPLAVDPTTGVSLPVANDPAGAVPTVVPDPGALDQPAPIDPSFTGGLPLPPPPAPITAPQAPTTAPLPAAGPDLLDQAPPEPVLEPVADTPALPDSVAVPEPAPVPLPEPEPTLPPEPAPEPITDEPVMPLDDEPAAEPVPAAPASEPFDVDNLLDLKQHALEQLTPLVDKLDQTPEERFRTKMMMIQSTDDQTLIKDAYEAAMAITDEKNRAQALLDIVNEINYFTAPQNNQ
jgi:hypothetical protein